MIHCPDCSATAISYHEANMTGWERCGTHYVCPECQERRYAPNRAYVTPVSRVNHGDRDEGNPRICRNRAMGGSVSRNRKWTGGVDR